MGRAPQRPGSKCFIISKPGDARPTDFDCTTREHTAQAGMDIIDGESLEGDRRTKNVVAIRGKLILRKLGPRH